MRAGMWPALAPKWMSAFVVMLVIGVFLFFRLPGSFLPEEDQGYALALVQLPPGSTMGSPRIDALHEKLPAGLSDVRPADASTHAAFLDEQEHGRERGEGRDPFAARRHEGGR